MCQRWEFSYPHSYTSNPEGVEVTYLYPVVSTHCQVKIHCKRIAVRIIVAATGMKNIGNDPNNPGCCIGNNLQLQVEQVHAAN